MLRLSRYVLSDIVRGRVLFAYTAILFLISLLFFQMEENSGKAVMSLMSVILLVVPLISVIFSTIHWYNSYEFIELMLTQPVSRKKVILSEYAGTAASLCAAFLAGVGIPVLIFDFSSTGLALILVGLLITLSFTSIAFLASVRTRDKSRGIGASLLLWFYFALVYDGIVLGILFTFSDYPLEKITLLLSALNPIDLGRIFLLLQMDISALMGVTSATYKDFFGSYTGIVFTMGIMSTWIITPLWLAVRSFSKKDL